MLYHVRFGQDFTNTFKFLQILVVLMYTLGVPSSSAV